MTHLQAVLDRAFPGATGGPFARDRYADADTDPVELLWREFMWDCGDCDNSDYDS
ncbi:hypothetical protein AB0D04_31970 [Streptomyces sp. NPDC048483]|uniref:hypothetical protein n=1 Tax=Streptomyces sp. NPDC048483 TaxID=3154927 RepID=UPI003446439F